MSKESRAADIAAIGDFIAEPSLQRFLIVVHTDPDFDALGSALAMAMQLEKQGYVTKVWIPEPLLADFHCLPSLDMICTDFPSDFDYDAVIALDISNESRLHAHDTLLASEHLLNIDHHHDNSKFGSVNVVWKISSVGEQLAVVFEGLGWELCKDTATCLYAAMAFDTGQFKYPSVTAETFSIVSKLLEQGVDHAFISRQIFDEKPLGYFERVKLALQQLEVDSELGYAYTVLPNCPPQTGNDIVDFVRGLKGVHAFAVFRSYEDGTVKVSLRSKTGVDVSAVAASFGGGGHKLAAGIRFEGIELDAVVSRVSAAIRDALRDWRRDRDESIS